MGMKYKDTIAIGPLKNKNKNKKPKWRFFTSRSAPLNCAIMAMLYSRSIGNQPRTRRWCLKYVIVYLARDIRPFVMYCVNGKPRSSLLIESTDSIAVFTWTLGSGSNPDRSRSHAIHLPGDLDLIWIQSIHHERWIRSGSSGSSAAKNIGAYLS